MKLSPCYLVHGKDVIHPLDNILKPRQLYHGKEHHEIALKEKHCAFILVRSNLKKAKWHQEDRLDSKTNDVVFKVGNFANCRNHYKCEKLDKRWQPNYAVVEKTGPMSYWIKNQLTSIVVKGHADYLRTTNVDKWDIPDISRSVGKSTMAVPVNSESSENN